MNSSLPPHLWRPTRREFLYVGLLGTVGTTMGDLFRAQAHAADAKLPRRHAREGEIRHQYLPARRIYRTRSRSTQKMTAPVEYRGPMEAIKTNLDGVYFSENLKETAKIADKITVVRSMTHGEAAHERGTHAMFTGYRPSPAIQYPSMGSVVSHELGPRADLRPIFLFPTRPRPTPAPVFSAPRSAPSLSAAIPPPTTTPCAIFTLPGGIDSARFAERREMRSVVDAHFSALENPTPSTAWMRSTNAPMP